MATRLEKSEPKKLCFRFSTLGATLQAAQDFSVVVDVQFGANEHARFRAGEGGTLFAPDGSWVPGAKFVVLAERDGATARRQLIAVPAGDAEYHFGLVIGGFTIGEDGHPDPATAWDLSSGSVHSGQGGRGTPEEAAAEPAREALEDALAGTDYSAAPAGPRLLPRSRWTFEASEDGRFLIVGALAEGQYREYRRVPLSSEDGEPLTGLDNLIAAIAAVVDLAPISEGSGLHSSQPLGIAAHGS